MNQVVVSITQAQALEMFGNVSSSFVGMDTATIPTLSGGKSNPMQGRVRKCSSFSVILGNSHDYANKVTKLAQSEVDGIWGKGEIELEKFQAEKLWKGMGEHIAGAVVRHKGTGDKYIMYYENPNSTKQVHYELDGKEISKGAIQGLVEKSRQEKVLEVDGVQFSVKATPVSTLKIESLKGFRMDGVHYMIVENI